MAAVTAAFVRGTPGETPGVVFVAGAGEAWFELEALSGGVGERAESRTTASNPATPNPARPSASGIQRLPGSDRLLGSATRGGRGDCG